MDVNRQQWVQRMLQYVSTVRPQLSERTRKLQEQTLLNLYEELEHINKPFEAATKPGILFEYLYQADPAHRRKPRTTVEIEAARYLLVALSENSFGLGYLGQEALPNPDDVIVEVTGDVASVIAVVEVKSGETRVEQLFGIEDQLDRTISTIDLRLRSKVPLPTIGPNQWPHEVSRLLVSSRLEKLLYIPDKPTPPKSAGWVIIRAPFSLREIRVIAAYLWYVDAEAKEQA